jgi:hypothetical protein
MTPDEKWEKKSAKRAQRNNEKMDQSLRFAKGIMFLCQREFGHPDFDKLPKRDVDHLKYLYKKIGETDELEKLYNLK